MGVLLAALILLAAAAGSVKMGGGLLYGSKALLIDGLTSIANLAALAGVAYYHRVSKLPPDEDHPFGHWRLGYGGVLLTMLAYAFVAGLAVSELVSTEPYMVGRLAPLMASLGLALYLGVIALARRAPWEFGPYASFTFSEVLESIVVIAASAAGSCYSYLVDYAGGVVITAYLFYELHGSFGRLVAEISDTAPPTGVVEAVRRIIAEEDLELRNLRLRMVTRERCMGEATVTPCSSAGVEEALERARRAEERALGLGCSLIVRVCPRRRGEE